MNFKKILKIFFESGGEIGGEQNFYLLYGGERGGESGGEWEKKSGGENGGKCKKLSVCPQNWQLGVFGGGESENDVYFSRSLL